jgi:GT2 family glycosyltransferase
VIPTLAADAALDECLSSLQHQVFQDFEILVVDNSGMGKVSDARAARFGARVLRMPVNIGFGAAVNAGFRNSAAEFLATLNDDAIAAPEWLAAMLCEMDRNTRVGMCAARILLAGENRIDSAGMLICADGSSKQRGHGEPAEHFNSSAPALFPSGCAALYRRRMLEQVGLFEEDFFLYCEDTDLGLRARRAGWECAYAAGALVEHRYSHSAGKASLTKAYYVERNRILVAVRNFPSAWLWRAPFTSLVRYWWHLVGSFSGRGKAAEFRSAGHSGWILIWIVLKAHGAAARRWRAIRTARRKIRSTATMDEREFLTLLENNRVPARQIASH